jgi:hypothetical protein
LGTLSIPFENLLPTGQGETEEGEADTGDTEPFHLETPEKDAGKLGHGRAATWKKAEG